MASPDDLSAVNADPFSEIISNFHKIFDSRDALTFLIGAGCSKCAGLPLTGKLINEVLASDKLDCDSKSILGEVEKTFSESVDAHIEDYLSEIIDFLAITDRRSERGARQNTIMVGDNLYKAEQLRAAANQIKQAIAGIIERESDISNHRDFVTSVHRPARVGRPPPSQPVDYLVLNYDTIIEDALALGKIPYADGIDGGATGWWNSGTFDLEALHARVIKLHGSIDWYEFPDESLPRRVSRNIQMQGDENHRILIWPASTKYREAQLDPFAQLADRARAALGSDKRTQRLLIICGYSFGDAHINLEIEKAILKSGGNLTVAVFTSEDEPSGKLKDWHDDSVIQEQVLIFANRGFFHGATEHLSEEELLWWKFENLTRILGEG